MATLGAVSAALTLGLSTAATLSLSVMPWLLVGVVLAVQQRQRQGEQLSEKLSQLSPQLQRQDFSAGDVILREGDPAECLYIIAAGRVAVFHVDPRGTRVDLVELGDGQFFGEIGLLSGGVRSASVEAIGPVTLMRMERATFEVLVASSRATGDAILRVARDRALSG